MKPEELFDAADSVESKEDFLRFVEGLQCDFEDSRQKEKEAPSNPYGAAANGWNNTDIAGFLEAMRAWAVDAKTDPAPSWRLFAKMLHNGKLYE
jgi:hypothetical protein